LHLLIELVLLSTPAIHFVDSMPEEGAYGVSRTTVNVNFARKLAEFTVWTLPLGVSIMWILDEEIE